MGDWTADANDALTISLVRSENDSLEDEDSNVTEFHPAFTYPVRLRLCILWLSVCVILTGQIDIWHGREAVWIPRLAD